MQLSQILCRDGTKQALNKNLKHNIYRTTGGLFKTSLETARRLSTLVPVFKAMYFMPRL